MSKKKSDVLQPVVYLLCTTSEGSTQVIHSAFVNRDQAVEAFENVKRIMSKDLVELISLPLRGVNHDFDMVNFTFPKDLNVSL